MIGDWIAQAGLLGLTILVLFAPGLLIGFGLRLRGLTLWASAPGISVGVLALLAIALPVLGIRWNHLSVTVAVVLVAALVYGLSFLLGRRRWDPAPQPPERRALVLLFAGLMVGAGLNAARLMSYIGTPTAISQTNDAVFHLNALRWVAESGSASSFDLSGLLGGTTFYPAAWHAVTSLVAVDLAAIPVAANLVALVTAAVVWPLSVTLLARVLSRGDALVTALAAALSAGLMAFPQLMFEWGVLYPYALSLAIVPAAVASTVVTVRAWMSAPHGQRLALAAGPALGMLLILAGTALAQPSTVLAWGALVMLWLTSTLLTGIRREGARPTVRWTVIAVGWLLLALVWLALAYLAGPVLWRSYRGVLGAVADVFVNSHSLLPAAWAMSVLLLAGIIAAFRERRLRWLIVAWAGVSLLYIVCVGTDLPVIKRLLTGPWYGDSFRIAALVPLVVVPLAALGLAMLLRWLAAVLARRVAVSTDALAGLALGVIAVVGAVSIAVAPVVLLRVADETDEQSRYTMNHRSYLSDDEYALLQDLPDLVPDDAVIIANPSTGAAFGYVLGRREVIPRTWSPPVSQAWDVLSTRLNDAGEDPAVCEALAAYGSPEYVLDFGIGGTGPGEYLMPGMTDFDDRPGFEEVAAEGDASLWRITACD
ncbi:DUF6541 family protein [Microbacterium sp. p3-SID336]|uniref:DUF6541 family protein n=1 Tax=Microbacterium sp. p3-SID336 TaxID=2916212 RepID=UPI0021A84C77|nr:DUF6541 family protein [Microbacterium sp. p3-SID336]MCT1477318.1 hypothetical protein [Microbacterium sp. p3-SID336]